MNRDERISIFNRWFFKFSNRFIANRKENFFMRRNLPLVWILLSLCATVALSQQGERDLKKEEKIWQQLEKVAPKSVETFKQATTAMDNSETEKAVNSMKRCSKK